MADFTSTHYIQLSGVNIVPSTTMTWSGETSIARAATISDVGTDGVLSEGIEAYLFGSKFSGFYITVGGQNFGIFTVGTFGLIPYNVNEFSLGTSGALVAEVTARTTSLYTPALHGSANCFLTGTRIATPHGPRAIETIEADDLVLTADGRAVPVIWVWRQEIINIQGLSEGLTPILISADALGPGLPARDLVVTADHAIALCGLLINAGALVDGAAIRRLTPAQMPARYCYWHIETAAHELLLAENCATESYVDYALRQGFDNYDAYLARYGSDRPITEMALPRISAVRLVPPMLRRGLGGRCLA